MYLFECFCRAERRLATLPHTRLHVGADALFRSLYSTFPPPLPVLSWSQEGIIFHKSGCRSNTASPAQPCCRALGLRGEPRSIRCALGLHGSKTTRKSDPNPPRSRSPPRCPGETHPGETNADAEVQGHMAQGGHDIGGAETSVRRSNPYLRRNCSDFKLAGLRS